MIPKMELSFTDYLVCLWAGNTPQMEKFAHGPTDVSGVAVDVIRISGLVQVYSGGSFSVFFAGATAPEQKNQTDSSQNPGAQKIVLTTVAGTILEQRMIGTVKHDGGAYLNKGNPLKKRIYVHCTDSEWALIVAAAHSPEKISSVSLGAVG